jgi:hypothetical protein
MNSIETGTILPGPGIFQVLKREAPRYWQHLTVVFFVFVAAVNITDFVYREFGLRLSEFFVSKLDVFHAFLHWLLSILVFSWLKYLLGLLWYSCTWIASLLFSVMPWFPDIFFPGWVSNLMLISLVVSRLFDSAYQYVPRELRRKAEEETTKEMEGKIYRQLGHWGPLWWLTQLKTKLIWKLVDWGDNILTRRVAGFALPHFFARGFVKALAAAVFLWGLTRLIGYCIIVMKVGNLTYPIIQVRRKVFRYFCISFVAAMIASSTFFMVKF